MPLHSWIRYTQEVVDAIVDPVTGRPFASSRGETIGEAIGCDRCGEPMTEEFVTRPCLPVDAPAPVA